MFHHMTWSLLSILLWNNNLHCMWMWFRAGEDTSASEIMSLKTVRTNVHFSKMSASIAIKSICGFA